MRSNEDRVSAVKRRVEQLEAHRRHRRRRVAALSSVAACLAIIVAAAFAMLGITERLAAGNYDGYSTTASIFSGSTAAGYIMIGILAFALGVCVTILCFRLKAFQKKDEEAGDGNGGVH